MMLNLYRVFAFAAVAILAVVVIAAFAVPHSQASATTTYGTLTQSQLGSLDPYLPGTNITVSGNAVYINGSATVPVLMGPMNETSMYSFEIFGVVNPELHVRAGSTVHFLAVNVDNDSYHNFAISARGPPYYYMAGMMQGGWNGNGFLAGMSFLSPMGNSIFHYASFSYQFSSAATLWYLCTYPGHAQQGMYGEIVVS